MAMTNKQLARRLDEAFQSHYGNRYENDVEWFENEDPHVWKCDIPNKQIGVKMTLVEADKRVDFEERKMQGNGFYGDYYYAGNYSWIR